MEDGPIFLALSEYLNIMHFINPILTRLIYFFTQFRLLAELVKSYGSCAALITEHVFESGMSDLVKEDTTGKFRAFFWITFFLPWTFWRKKWDQVEVVSSLISVSVVSALAFLLDELLVSKSADKECSNLIKTLVAALASCNHFPEAQSTLVMEVKGKFRFCCFLTSIF